MNTIERVKKEIVHRRDEYLRRASIVEAGGGKDVVSEAKVAVCEEILLNIRMIIIDQIHKRTSMIHLISVVIALILTVCYFVFFKEQS